MNLTKRSIAAIPTPEKGTVATWDDALPGFGVRVSYSGRAVYVIRYRNRHGKERLYTFARVADMHPEAARDMAKRLFSRVREGEDPAEQRIEDRNAPTLTELRDRMFADHIAKRKAGTHRSYEQLWRLHIIPAIGADRVVAELDERDIDRLVKHCGDRHATSNRALAVLSKALNLAERWKWRAKNSNPVRGTERHEERKRERTLEPAEIPAVWAALDQPSLMRSASAFFKLLMLTGLRDSEWRLALWSWVDFTNEVLKLPDSKTGQRTEPLSPDVLDILRDLPRSSVYILPGRKGGPMSGQRKIWRRVCLQAGLTEPIRIHDIRHTVGSLAHRAGATQREVADLLGHKQMSTAARYIHGPASERHSNAARASAAILDMAKTRSK
jgi:integrase